MKYFLFLGMLLFVISCGQEEQRSVKEPEEADKPGQESIAVREEADTLLRDDALLDRLRPSWTVEEVLERMPGAEITDRTPVQNRHVPNQTDTILTISKGESKIRFYRLPEEDLLQEADVKDPGISFGGRLEVGMAASALPDVLPALQARNTLPGEIRIEGERVPSSLEISLEGGEVAQIHFEGYVD